MADKHLTQAGWPRPVVDGWPVPWVSPANNLSTMDGDRVEAIETQKLCQVCGQGHEPGTRVFFCVDGSTKMPKVVPGAEGSAKFAIKPMDHGILHERCAKLAVGRCPVLARIKAEGTLLVMSAPLSAVYLRSRANHVKGRVYLRIKASRSQPEPALSSTGVWELGVK